MTSPHRNALALAAFVAITTASCTGTPPPPVTVLAAPADAQALTGIWEGEYASAETQRSGSIRFFLSSRADSAFGDVVMLAHHWHDRAHGNAVDPSSAHTASRTLSIRFVVVEGDELSGTMDPYTDEDGSMLHTRFTGQLRGDEIRGRYVTRNVRTSETTSGEWSVRRTRIAN